MYSSSFLKMTRTSAVRSFFGVLEACEKKRHNVIAVKWERTYRPVSVTECLRCRISTFQVRLCVVSIFFLAILATDAVTVAGAAAVTIVIVATIV
jgi:hypothetical protein